MAQAPEHDPAPVTIAKEPLGSEDARTLIAALNADIQARYPDPADNFFTLEAEEVAPGRGAFLVVRKGGQPIGCGAIRKLDATTAEVKRMYVVPELRGRGIARRVIAALEEEARAIGVTRLVLETGDRQEEAVALYERAGFAKIPCFGPYADAPASRCFGKVLAPA